MGGPERVVDAFGPFGETGKTARLTQASHARAAPGENLMRVGLVPDVPNQLVGGRVEHAVERDRQLDDAQSGAKMTVRRYFFYFTPEGRCARWVPGDGLVVGRDRRYKLTLLV